MDTVGLPTTLPEFAVAFPSDAACATYLEKLRWPGGFTCPKCETVGEPYRFPKRSSVVLRCRCCQANTSLTAGTVMQGSHSSLTTWFWGAYLMTTQTPGQSARQFQRQLGIRRYETAFQILHKLRAGMVRPDRDTIGGQFPVEVDETLVGGSTRGEGRGVHHKATVVGAIEVRRRVEGENHANEPRKGRAEMEPLNNRAIYAGRLRLRLVQSRNTDNLISFVKECVAPGALIRTDGWQGYDDLATLGYRHEAVVLDGDPEKAETHLPMIHLAFSNLKTWLLGTHHGVSRRHLQAYLNEYVFRFNRRFYPMTSFNSILGIAVHAVPPTYEELYSGKWPHPGT